MTYFSDKELECKCGCGLNQISDRLRLLIDTARAILGYPLYSNSACRCTEHNKNIGGVDSSAHTRNPCTAIDLIVADGDERFRLLVALILAAVKRYSDTSNETSVDLTIEEYRDLVFNIHSYIRGIGIAKTFVHVDTDYVKPRPTVWGY